VHAKRPERQTAPPRARVERQSSPPQLAPNLPLPLRAPAARRAAGHERSSTNTPSAARRARTRSRGTAAAPAAGARTRGGIQGRYASLASSGTRLPGAGPKPPRGSNLNSVPSQEQKRSCAARIHDDLGQAAADATPPVNVFVHHVVSRELQTHAAKVTTERGPLTGAGFTATFLHRSSHLDWRPRLASLGDRNVVADAAANSCDGQRRLCACSVARVGHAARGLYRASRRGALGVTAAERVFRATAHDIRAAAGHHRCACRSLECPSARARPHRRWDTLPGDVLGLQGGEGRTALHERAILSRLR